MVNNGATGLRGSEWGGEILVTSWLPLPIISFLPLLLTLLMAGGSSLDELGSRLPGQTGGPHGGGVPEEAGGGEEPILMGMQVRLQEDDVVKSQVWDRSAGTGPVRAEQREEGGAAPRNKGPERGLGSEFLPSPAPLAAPPDFLWLPGCPPRPCKRAPLVPSLRPHGRVLRRTSWTMLSAGRHTSPRLPTCLGHRQLPPTLHAHPPSCARSLKTLFPHVLPPPLVPTLCRPRTEEPLWTRSRPVMQRRGQLGAPCLEPPPHHLPSPWRLPLCPRFPQSGSPVLGSLRVQDHPVWWQLLEARPRPVLL